MKKFYTYILFSLYLASCTQEPVKVEYHLNEFYGYNEAGDSVAVLNTGEDVVGPKQINGSTYTVDEYQAPSEIIVEKIENLETPELKKEEIEISKQPTLENQPKIEYNLSSTKNSSDSKIINVSAQDHTVSKGETLYAISRKYNIPILPIIIVNKLSAPYNLNTGQKIRIPEARFHVVDKKETLYSISRTYGVDMSSLVKTNRLEAPYELKIGQKLQIPFPTYKPEPELGQKSTLIAQKEISKNEVESSIQEEEGSKPDEVELHTRDAEVIKPHGLAIMIPPTLKPVEQKAPSYKTALLRKELKQKAQVLQKSYKDDGNFMWPAKGEVTGKFGLQKDNEYNDGIYISAPAGAFVKSSLSGKVVYTGDSLKSYGNLVIIKHDNGLLSAYAHLSKIDVKKDQFVKKGQVIGKVGQTGKVKSPKLYFAIRRGKEARDPMMYLR